MTTLALTLLMVLLMDAKPEAFADDKLNLPENPYAVEGNLSCGPRCVTFIDRFFRGESTYEQVLKKCPPGPFGTNLEQVQFALTELGYHSASFKTAPSELERLQHPAILYVKMTEGLGHFIVLLGWNEKTQRFRIFSPPEEVGEVDRAWMEKRATGLGLVVSNQPLPAFDSLLKPARTRVTDWLITAVLLIYLVAVLRGASLRSTKSPAGVSTLTSLLLPLMLASCTGNMTSTSSPLKVDVGRVMEGQDIKHTFRVPNETSEPFRVVHVKRSCSCQVVKADTNRDIAPGDCAEISVEVPTNGRDGIYRLDFDVETKSASGVAGVTKLELTSQVEAKIKAIPSRLMFGTVDSSKAVQTRISVKTNKPNLGESFRTAEVVDNPDLTVQLTEKAIGLLTFEVSLGANAPPGDIFGKVLLKFDDDEVPVLEIPVFGRKVGELKTIPRNLVLPTSTKRGKFRVLAENGTKFKLTGVDCPEGVLVHGVEDIEGASFDLDLEVTSDSVPASFQVKIKTNLPSQSEVQLLVVRPSSS